MPTVSVIIASYNHAEYVCAAIQSVLLQTNVDFELLIADDGSSDETAAAIRSIRDDRIVFEAFGENRGAALVLNELVAKAKGEFIAVMNSDDIWLRVDKLKMQVDILSNEPSIAATFGRAILIDKNGLGIKENGDNTANVFDQQNRSQSSWLRRFFESGNCLCHPTAMIRRSVLNELGPFDSRLRQLPDFDMWVRMVKNYPIHVSCEKLIGFRILPGENASAPTLVNQNRDKNEHFLIIRRFFMGIRLDFFRDAFQSRLRFGDVATELDARIESALLMLDEQSPLLGPPYQVAGMLALNELLGEPCARELLKEKYHVDDHWFQQKTGSMSVLYPMVREEQLKTAVHRGEILDAEIRSLEKECSERLVAADLHNMRLENEVCKLLQDVDRLTRCVEVRALEVSALRSSSSWRVTRPLRKIGTLVRKIPGVSW